MKTSRSNWFVPSMMVLLANFSFALTKSTELINQRNRRLEDPYFELQVPEPITDMELKQPCFPVMCGVLASYLRKFKELNINELVNLKVCTQILVSIFSQKGTVDGSELKDGTLMQQLSLILKKNPSIELILLVDEPLPRVPRQYVINISTTKFRRTVFDLMKTFNFTGLHLTTKMSSSQSPHTREKFRNVLLNVLQTFSGMCHENNWTIDVSIVSPFEDFLGNGYITRIQSLVRYVVLTNGRDRSIWELLSKTDSKTSPDYLISLLESEGIDKDKIFIHIPLNAMVFDNENRFPQTNLSIVGSQEDILINTMLSQNQESKSYSEMCKYALNDNASWSLHKDESIETAFFHGKDNNPIIVVETPRSLYRRVLYFVRNGMSGITVFNVYDDDYLGNSCGQQFPLLRTISHALTSNKSCDKDADTLKAEANLYTDYIQKLVAVGTVIVVITIIACAVFVERCRSHSHDNLFSKFFKFVHAGEVYTQTDSLFEGFSTRQPHNISVNGATIELSYDSSVEIPESKFVIDQNMLLGGGAFGTVYKCHIGNIVVAAKTMNDTSLKKQDIMSFLDEIRLMRYVGKHKNIIHFIGANTSNATTGRIYIFVEYCEHGSLKKVLKANRNSFNDLLSPAHTKYQVKPSELQPVEINGVSTKDLVHWALQVSRGMEYLTLKKVIHGDLATRNVLVASRDCVKISDFGLARKLYNHGMYKKNKVEPLPWRWMAIESLKDLEFSGKSDVWSYGITLWEIFSLAELPYHNIPWTPTFANQLTDGLRLSQPIYFPSEIFEATKQCWQINPEDRPEFSEMSSVMEAQITAYLDE